MQALYALALATCTALAAPAAAARSMQKVSHAGDAWAYRKYLDIWLVDKSGRFQLDTLTEGQL